MVRIIKFFEDYKIASLFITSFWVLLWIFVQVLLIAWIGRALNVCKIMMWLFCKEC